MYAVHEVSELLFDVQIVSVTGKLCVAISMLYSYKTVKPHTRGEQTVLFLFFVDFNVETQQFSQQKWFLLFGFPY